MFDLSGAGLIGNLLFGSIGFVAFIYGKRMNAWKVMLCGLGLMVVPYFIVDTALLYVFGAVGSGALERELRGLAASVRGWPRYRMWMSAVPSPLLM